MHGAYAQAIKSLSEFEKFNRIEIVHLVQQFVKDMELFLNQQQMSAAKCHVIEETLYKMAGIEKMPTNSKFEIDYKDKTRCQFVITDMPDEDLDKFITLFHQLGDDSAYKTGNKVKTWGNPESCALVNRLPEKRIKYDTIEVDGEFLAKTIFPLFKQDILNATPERLAPYIEKSKEYLKALAEKLMKENNPSQIGFFSNNTNAIESINIDDLLAEAIL